MQFKAQQYAVYETKYIFSDRKFQNVWWNVCYSQYLQGWFDVLHVKMVDK